MQTNIGVTLIGEDGNAFNLIGIVRKAIRTEYGPGRGNELANEFVEEAMDAGSYDELIGIINEWVVVT